MYLHGILSSTRGLGAFLNEDGVGLCFSIRDAAGKLHDRFFFNIGQPNPSPPMHPIHVDDPGVCDRVRLHLPSFRPYYARYELLDGRNEFEWIERDGLFHLRCRAADEVVFREYAVLPPAGGEPAPARSGKVLWERLVPPDVDGPPPPRGFFAYGVQWGVPYSGEIRLVVSPSPLPGYAAAGSSGAGPSSCPPAPPGLGPPPRLCEPWAVPLFYNLCTAPGSLRNRLYIANCKSWVPFMARVLERPDLAEGPYVAAWDASLSAAALSEEWPELSARCLLSVLEALQPDGRLPQLQQGRMYTNRTNPPVWFVAAARLRERLPPALGDALQAALHPLLVRNYEWFKREQGNGDFTYSWGLDNEDEVGRSLLPVLKGKWAAVLESGLDDSPMYTAGVEMAPGGRLLDHACVDLTALMAFASGYLRDSARSLGLDPAPFEEDVRRHADALKGFHDPSAGLLNAYRRLPNGGRGPLHPELTPCSLYPLLAPGLDPAVAADLLRLARSPHFARAAGDRPELRLPSVSFLSREYNGDGDYWRGRIWPPMVYLAGLGVREHDGVLYRELRAAAQALLEAEWGRSGACHENYSAETGRGYPRPGTFARSCAMYSWAGLLGALPPPKDEAAAARGPAAARPR
eukprot:tig00020909_g15376.t1